MNQLAGYWVAELIYEGARTRVYRGVRQKDERAIVLKKLRKEYPTFNELLQFRHQYVLTKNLYLPGIVKSLALEKDGNGYVLVMEDVGGISLSQYYRERSLSLEEFFPIALFLCKILAGLYRHRIIHKDIKPSNILINPETKETFLIDFSIASLLPRETQTLQNPNQLEGTLAYISPEQTGRMNRGIDYRSDFYSLGVTFYELLTGKLPFVSEDPMELVHSQIAKIAEPPHLVKADIPQVLSQMVMKLMAKNAEERYQSALGLKFDLEKCLSMWQETGNIEAFELGERDISDNFNVPEKLYGRETEVQTLLDAFSRVAAGKTEMMLVAGFSGIGKTTVVNEVHKPIVRQRGYFIKGKFDQFQRNIPFSALVIAFRDLMEQLLGESNPRLESWKTSILNALGENAQVIIEVIPELERVIGKQPPVPELSGSAAQNRFNLLFQKFIRVFTSKEHPLVIFLDDLQWADSASLKLIQLLMGEVETGYLLLLGAYRDNEVFPAHPLMLTLDEIAKLGATIDRITLVPLSQGHLNRLVADTLHCELQQALPLTELVYQKTKGNPFFATQFLKGLHEDGWIAFNFELGHWQCDMTRVRELALTDDVVEFMAARLHKLPEETRELLKLAACIGNQFDLETLAVVSERSEVEAAQSLWGALQEGFILPLNEIYKFYQAIEGRDKGDTGTRRRGYGETHQTRRRGDTPDTERRCPRVPASSPFPHSPFPKYKFLHDRVQQAAYSLIPDGSQPEIYLKIGQLLFRSIPESQRQERIFEIVDPLNYAVALTEPALKEELIGLNLLAGRQAKAVTAYDAAFRYLQLAIELLSPEPWQRNYSQTLEVYNSGVEAAYLSGRLSEMEAWIEIVSSNAASIYDRIPVARIKLQALSAGEQGQVVGAALEMLRELEIPLPEKPTPGELQEAREMTEKMLERQAISSIVELPIMTNRHFLAVAAILQASIPTIYRLDPDLFQLMVLKLIQLSLEHGNTSLSSFGYACYGLICCSDPQKINRGHEIAEMAVALAEKMGDRSLQARTLFVATAFVRVWGLPLNDVLEALQRAYQLALDAGDLEFVGYAAWHYCHKAFFSSQNLQSLKTKVSAYVNALQNFGQKVCANLIEPYQTTIELLASSHSEVPFLSEFRSKLSLQQAVFQETCDSFGLFFCLLTQGMVYCWFGDFRQAATNIDLAYEQIDTVAGEFIVAIFKFYACLTRLRLYPQQNPEERAATLAKVTADAEALLSFARHAPTTYQHKYDLVRAEYHRVLEEKLEAIEDYDRAIAGAKKHGCTQEEALANELAAKFYLEWGKEKIARTYLVDAYYAYADWGAIALLKYLEERYPELLASIIAPQITPMAAKTTINSSQTSYGNISTFLDWSTAIKTNQVISEVLDLEELLSKLMETLMQNAGASKGVLLLPEADSLVIEAIGNYPEVASKNIDISSVGRSLPLESSEELPLAIVRTVWHDRKTLVVNDVPKETRFAADSYLMRQQPKSLVCLPLTNRGKLAGILYLENASTAGAFTSDRLELLKVLSSQAAISLENARLYERSQDYAQQLEKYLQELKQVQLQLIQSEKMATIGELTAGIAHEINNPVGFIAGNLRPASEYVRDTIELLNLYRQTFPCPGEIIEAKIEEIDLDYLLQDFPETIESMKEGTERIAQISKSMRTFSRADTAELVFCNIHWGIDSTLLILKHRLKANANRPEIEVIKNYGNLPELKCYPGQLNQVFMNLLSNAIDALEEANKERNFAEIESTQNRIVITTEIDEEKGEALIKIADNGPGMSEKVKQKIFDHLFTTKRVGKGTGLGLSISRQIVEEKHGGTLTCTSEFGKGTEFAIALPIVN